MQRRKLLPGVPPVLATLLMATATSSAPAQNESLSIRTPVTIVESAQEPGAVKRATEDLQNDFRKVLGQSPRLVERVEDAGPTAVLIAQSGNVPSGIACATTSNLEAFAFSIAQTQAKGSAQKLVCLTGADMRGTIYAIYEFSQRYLGVDPMYLWTDKEPARRTSVELPADFAHVYPSPVIRYRGFFTNDEDLLTGWILPPKGEQSGIALKVWDQIFETILRLKGNMVVPGSWIFPDDAQVQAAALRGLIVNQHHATPLGVNVARWPKGVPYDFTAHPDILKNAWTNAVADYKPGEEILWTVGLRGLSDQSYSALDPSVRGNDALLGERVSQAIAEQMRIVRARYPNAHFITNLWQEGDRLMHEGYLKIPPEVTLVWADTGYGDMQDEGKVAAGQGAYIHVAMMNYNANQLTEMVSVKTLQSELGRYIKAGATEYVLMNTSDIRPVAMTARAVMETAWGGVSPGPDAEDAYYKKWITDEFGAKAVPSLESVYKDYFAAPTHHGRSQDTAEDVAPHVDGDQHYHSDARNFLVDELSGHQAGVMPNQSPKWTPPRLMNSGPSLKARREADIRDCETAQPRWDAIWQKAVEAQVLVDPARRNYYQAEVLTMITVNRESNRMLLNVGKALDDMDAGETAKAKTETAQALASLDTIEKSMSAAEYGKWKNWYRGDWLTGVHRTDELVKALASRLDDPFAPMPAPLIWNDWEAYYHIMNYEGDRTVDINPSPAAAQ